MRKPIGKIKDASKAREFRRKLAIRKKIIGSSERPRVCTTRTNKNLFVQVIDDSLGKTLFSVQTFGKNSAGSSANVESAKTVGAEVAKKLKDNKIETVVYDRGGKVYGGVVKAVAESMRENGIKL